MDHPTRPNEGLQIYLANSNATRVIVQRRIGVRSHVGGQRDGAHIHRALRRNLGCPVQLKGRVSWKDRAASVNGWGNIPNFFHQAQR